jgi:hypothetical protein
MLHQPLAPLETLPAEPLTAPSDVRSTIPDGNAWELATFVLVGPGSMALAVATTFLILWAGEGHQLVALWSAVGLWAAFVGALACFRLGAASR